MAKNRRLAQHVPPRTAWPTLTPLEPMSGDFGVLHPPSDRVCLAQEDTFLHLYTEALQHGIFCPKSWEQWASQCRIPTRPWLENSPPVSAKILLPLELLSNICEDYIPHIGLFIDELLWAETYRGDLRVLGGAIASTLPLMKHGHTPLYKIANQHPRLRPPLHQSLTAHYRTPTMLWQKSGSTAIPMLPLGKQYHPNKVDNIDDIESDFFIAKVIHIDNQQYTGTLAHLVLPVDNGLALQSFLQNRLQIAWYRYRRHNSKICYEDILRERSDILYRSAFEIKS